ncbi:MAG: DNA repair protein RecN [Thermodesulfobacteriota bacterium]
MLQELKIENLALIERLEIAFGPGLAVFTGETGAGKSIVLAAVHLLSGGKAPPTWIRTGASQATVEALFDDVAANQALAELLASQDLEAGGVVVVRRVIGEGGRSRFYVNGHLVPARLAGEVLAELVSLAGQHEQQRLLDPGRHLDLLDTAADLGPTRRAFAADFDRWRALAAEVTQLRQALGQRDQRRDFLAFQIAEIEAARLTPDEEERLLARRQVLKSADTLTRLGREAHELLREGVWDQLSSVRQRLEQMAQLDPATASILAEVAAAFYTLGDQAGRLEAYLETVQADPAELEATSSRLDLLARLKRKYGASVAAILDLHQALTQELAALESVDDRLGQLGAEEARLAAALRAAAAGLSAARHAAAERIARAVQAELQALGLGQACFAVRFRDQPETAAALTRDGWDRPELLFSANPGEPAKPLAAIASGGELSRLLLAIKSILAQKDQVGCVIFDEVDAGIGGQAADAVARKIRDLARHHQVLCITHLPQIASCADTHFLVDKQVRDGRTHTRVLQLDRPARVGELARMLDGTSGRPETVAFAEALLTASQKGA